MTRKAPWLELMCDSSSHWCVLHLTVPQFLHLEQGYIKTVCFMHHVKSRWDHNSGTSSVDWRVLSSPMAHRLKDLVLSLQQLGSLLWRRFDPWPGNFRMPQAQPKRTPNYFLEFPWWQSRLRIWCCHICDMDSIPGPGNSVCHKHGQKLKNKN